MTAAPSLPVVDHRAVAPQKASVNDGRPLPATDHREHDTQRPHVGGGKSLSGDDWTDQYALLRFLSEQFDDIEQNRIAASNRIQALTDPRGKGTAKGLPAWAPEVVALQTLVDQIEAAENGFARELTRTLKTLPLWEWIDNTPGVGPKQAARLLGVIGDPASRPNPAKLFAYCGYHVVDGAAPTRRQGQKANWSPSAKSRAWLVAKSCLKAGVRKTDAVDDSDGYDHTNRVAITRYGQVYLDGRAKYTDATHGSVCVRCGPKGRPAEVGSPLSLKHQDARATRLVAKAVLLDLWREAHRTLTED